MRKSNRIDDFLESVIVKKIIVYVFVSSILIMIVVSEIKRTKETKEIEESPSWVWGEVYDIYNTGRGYKGLNYKYVVDSQMYFDKRRYSPSMKLTPQECIGYQFRVIYSSQDPENNHILFIEDDYRRHKMRIPKTIYTKKRNSKSL